MTLSANASLLIEPNRIEFAAIDFDAPTAGEIQLRVVAAGVCHTDLNIYSSPDGWGRPYPLLLGHEGAGVVEAVGRGVDHLSVGDRVAISCRVACGRCRQCRRGNAGLCSNSAPRPGRIRWSGHDEIVTPALGVGLFAESVLVDASAAIPIPEELPTEQAAILGCAVMTGVGAVRNTARVPPGSSVAVIGCGGIGLSVIQGARMAGATSIVAVDISPQKLALAGQLGASDLIDASVGDPVEQVLDVTEGEGVDFAFEAVGRPDCAEQAIRILSYAGTAILIGIPQRDEVVLVDLGGDHGFFSKANSLRVSHGGEALPQHDLPHLMKLAVDQQLDLEGMISHRVGLAEVQKGFDLMRAGESARTVVLVE